MNRSFIALGTNIEPRIKYIENALSEISGHTDVQIIKKSSIYQTAPVGYLDQGRFLNMVVEVRTSLTSLQLLHYCQKVEKDLGRNRTIKNGPRTIDLDILLFNNENKETEQLTIPHPRMHERAFVLIPLNEIIRDEIVPSLGGSVSDLVGKLTLEQLGDVNRWKMNDLI